MHLHLHEDPKRAKRAPSSRTVIVYVFVYGACPALPCRRPTVDVDVDNHLSHRVIVSRLVSSSAFAR